MPTAAKRITDSVVRLLPLPSLGEVLYWCPATPGFGVRVSATGVRAFVLQRRVNGKDTRRTLGKATGSGSISTDAARLLALQVSSELSLGTDRLNERKAARVEAQHEGVTFEKALQAFLKGKRRGKDGLPLKERTKADYLGMVAIGGTAKDGTPFNDGILYQLADKSIHKITAEDVRKIFKAAEPRGKRQQTYAMQILRAVLNWHGVQVPDSPLSKATAGKSRIVLAPTTGNARPIPPEKLGAWWKSAAARAGKASADGLALLLLTGCRPGEVFGSTTAPGLLVRDVDFSGARVTLPDTKNRRDHVVMLSKQALALLQPHCKDKAPGAKVFDVIDPGRTMATINAEAVAPGITPHKLRHTFASVAEDLVSGYALKRMLNHTDGGDVTGGHYVGKSEAQLRAAWQTVADFIVNA